MESRLKRLNMHTCCIILKFPLVNYKACKEVFLYLFHSHIGGIKVVNSLEKAISKIDICFMASQKP